MNFLKNLIVFSLVYLAAGQQADLTCSPNRFRGQVIGHCVHFDQLQEKCVNHEIFSASEDCASFAGSWCCYVRPVATTAAPFIANQALPAMMEKIIESITLKPESTKAAEIIEKPSLAKVEDKKILANLSEFLSGSAAAVNKVLASVAPSNVSGELVTIVAGAEKNESIANKTILIESSSGFMNKTLTPMQAMVKLEIAEVPKVLIVELKAQSNESLVKPVEKLPIAESKVAEIKEEPKKSEIKEEPKKTEIKEEPKKVEIKEEVKKVDIKEEPKKVEVKLAVESKPAADIKEEPKKVEPKENPKKTEIKEEPKKVEIKEEPKKIEEPRKVEVKLSVESKLPAVEIIQAIPANESEITLQVIQKAVLPDVKLNKTAEILQAVLVKEEKKMVLAEEPVKKDVAIVAEHVKPEAPKIAVEAVRLAKEELSATLPSVVLAVEATSAKVAAAVKEVVVEKADLKFVDSKIVRNDKAM